MIYTKKNFTAFQTFLLKNYTDLLGSALSCFPYSKLLNRLLSTTSTSSFDFNNLLIKDFSYDKNSFVFKLYGKLFLNKYFIDNIGNILEDLYDNNEFVIFKLYFIKQPKSSFAIILEKLSKHLDRYPLEFLDSNIVKFYKNTGLVGCCYIFVWLSQSDINNLKKIATDFKDHIYKNIGIINLNIKNDMGNTIINHDKGMTLDDELLLLICIDRNNEVMNLSRDNFYSNN